jgi:hypothetical protein
MKSKRAKSKPAKRAKRAARVESAAKKSDVNRNPELAMPVERALLRAGENARRTARMHGTHLSTCGRTAGWSQSAHSGEPIGPAPSQMGDCGINLILEADLA